MRTRVFVCFLLVLTLFVSSACGGSDKSSGSSSNGVTNSGSGATGGASAPGPATGSAGTGANFGSSGPPASWQMHCKPLQEFLLSDAELVQTMLSATAGGPTPGRVCQTLSQSEKTADEIAEYYMALLPSQGWTMEDHSVLGHDAGELEDELTGVTLYAREPVVASRQGVRIAVTFPQPVLDFLADAVTEALAEDGSATGPRPKTPNVTVTWMEEAPLAEAQKLLAALISDTGKTPLAPLPDGPFECLPTGRLVPNGAEVTMAEASWGSCWIQFSVPGSASSVADFYKQNLGPAGFPAQAHMIAESAHVSQFFFMSIVPGRSDDLSIHVTEAAAQAGTVSVFISYPTE